MSFGTDSFGVAPFGSTAVASAGGTDATAPGATLTATSELIPGGATGSEPASITLIDVPNLHVFQRTGASAAVAVSGGYTGIPVAIEARVVLDGTSTEVVGWSVLDAAPTAGTFDGTITVPQGGRYNLQVRFSNDTGVVDNGTNAWSVGMIGLLIGQSNIANWYSGANVSVPLGSRHSGSAYPSTVGSWAQMTSFGAGESAFAKALTDQYGIPVGLLNYAVGGTAITAWDQPATDIYARNAKSAVDDIGGKVEFVIWGQGEGDALGGMSQATYETNLTNTIAAWRAAIGNGSQFANLPWLISTLGRGTAVSLGSETSAAAVRAAQFAVAAAVPNTYIAASALDLALTDTVHYTTASYITIARRFAQTVKYLLGDASYHRGPSIVSASRVDDTHTDVTISHRGGTDFTPTSAINGFELDDGGTIVVPSAAVRQSSTVIRLTHAAVGAGATVRYGYGMDGGVTFGQTITNVVVDNTAMALPLEQSSGWVITAEAIAPGASLTGTGTIAAGAAAGEQNGTAAGATLTGTATMVPGAASGEQNAVAPGATLTGSGSILPGAASGEAAGDATAPGAVLVGAGQIVPGAAEGQQDASAPGAVLTGSSSLQPGAASGDLDGTAPGATLVGGGQFVPGNASDGTSDPVFALAVSIEKRTQLGLAAGYVTAYLWQEIALENVYYKGGVARLHCRVADSAGRDIDPPALSLMMRYGDGVPSELVYGVDTEIVRAGQGRYYADVPLTERGTMYYRWETGALDTGAAESSIVVRGGRFQ